MKDKELEEILLNRVKFIGDGEWTLLGTPNELMEELKSWRDNAVKEATKELQELVDDLKYELIEDNQ